MAQSSEGSSFGGLAQTTAYATFADHFGKYGIMFDAVIMKNPLDGTSRGFGLVTYADPSVVDTVINDTHVLDEKQVDVSSNLLSKFPDTFESLHNLKSLCLSNNGLKSVPSKLFKMCQQLTTLDLHNTEITLDILRQVEGWENFDERRRLKHQKQLDF